MSPAIEHTLRMLQCVPCFIMIGITCFIMYMWENTFAYIIHSQSLSGRLSMYPPLPVPALLIRRSICPHLSMAHLTIFCVSSNSDTSACMHTISSAPSSLATGSHARTSSPSISTARIFIPLFAASLTYSNPKPLAAPVITATLPLKSFI